MSAVTVLGYAFPPLRPHKWIRNGKYPDAQLQADLANHVNAGAIIRLKEHCRFGTPLPSLSPLATTRNRWRCAFRTSAFVRYLSANIGVSLNTTGSTGKGAVVTIRDSSGTTMATAELSVTGTGSTNPSTWRDGQAFFLDGGGDLWEPDPYTTYFATFVDNAQSSLVFGNIFEWAAIDSTTENGLAVANFASSSPVLDSDRQAVAELGATLWTQQGSHLFNWSTNVDLLPPVGEADPLPERFVESTFANYQEYNAVTGNVVVDGNGEPFVGDDAAFLLDLEGRARVSEGGDVTVRMHGYAQIYESNVGFPALKVYLRAYDGTIMHTLSWPGTGSLSPYWQSGSFTLPAEAAYYYVTYAIDGTGDWDGAGRVYAVSLFPEDVAE